MANAPVPEMRSITVEFEVIRSKDRLFMTQAFATAHQGEETIDISTLVGNNALLVTFQQPHGDIRQLLGPGPLEMLQAMLDAIKDPA